MGRLWDYKLAGYKDGAISPGLLGRGYKSGAISTGAIRYGAICARLSEFEN